MSWDYPHSLSHYRELHRKERTNTEVNKVIQGQFDFLSPKESRHGVKVQRSPSILSVWNSKVVGAFRWVTGIVGDLKNFILNGPRNGLCEPNLLKLFRWFVPRRKRADIDVIINDIRLDANDMTASGEHWTWVWAMKTWHSLTSVIGIVWDGITRVILRIWMIFWMAQQIRHAVLPSSDDEASDE